VVSGPRRRQRFLNHGILGREERQGVIERTGPFPLTKNTITDPTLLEEKLARVRERGYAISFGHRNLGAVAIVASIWGTESRVVGDLALSIPEARFDFKMEAEMVLRLVVGHARRISGKLAGARP
jgi:DNA-binding IclR family transcriptional regulator